MKEFVEWLKDGWEIVCMLFPWLLQGVAYLAMAAVYYLVLVAADAFIFRRNATVEDMKSLRGNIEFIILLILSIALAILTVEMEVCINNN